MSDVNDLPAGGGNTASGGTNTQAPTYKPWTAQVRKDLLGPELADKDLNDFVSSYKSLAQEKAEYEAKLKDAIFPPREGATEAEIQAYKKRLGVPETADGYDIKGENVPADKLASLKEFALKNNFTRAQTAALFESEMAKQKAEAVQAQKEREANIKATEDYLLNEYGPEEAKTKLDHALRVIDKIGGQALKDELNRTGIGNNPELVKFMIRIAEPYNEDGVATGGAGGREQGPDFKKIYPSMNK